MKLSELDEWLHGEIGMYFVLDNLGWDPRRAENVEEERPLDIANTDVLGQAFVDEFLQRAPSLVHRIIFCRIGLETAGATVRVYLRR